jgi:hypothetical protein
MSILSVYVVGTFEQAGRLTSTLIKMKNQENSIDLNGDEFNRIHQKIEILWLE